MKAIGIKILFITFLVSPVFAADVRYQLLEQARIQQSLPHLTLEEKKIVVDQARMVLRDIFVHRELKLQHFGKGIDPLPVLDEMEKNLASLSPKDFQQQMVDVFFSQNDWHTVYNLPKPYACYTNFLPVRFREVMKDGKRVIAIRSLVDKKDVLDTLPSPLNVEVGDILLSYESLPVEAAVKRLEPLTGGANPDSRRMRAIRLLSYLPQKYYFAPEQSTVKLHLMRLSGETYDVTLPWISEENLKCVGVPSPRGARMGSQDDLINFNRFFRQKSNKSSAKSKFTTMGENDLMDTREPTLKYRFIKNENGTFGYISLESFIPQKLSFSDVLLEVKGLLKDKFQKTDGLIFDVRDNGGGIIPLAEGLVQFFTPKDPELMTFVMRSSVASVHFMQTAVPFDPFIEAGLNARALGLPFTVPLPISNLKREGSLGQYYFRPVAVLNNALCYSACDMFSAQMQDRGAGIIFGENSTTGAGGANNGTLGGMLMEMGNNNPGPYKKLPHGIDMSMAFRQAFRTGPHAGLLLEHIGVVADVQVPPSFDDLFSNDGQLFLAITNRLRQEGEIRRPWVHFKEESVDLILDDADASMSHVEWEQTTSLEFRRNGQSLGKISVEENNPGREINLSKFIDVSRLLQDEVEILGFNQNERAWRKIINFRVIPPGLGLGGETINVDFVTGIKPWIQLESSKDGWQVRDGALKIGAGPQYLNGISTNILFFGKLSDTPYELNFSAMIDTEKDFDYFTVSVKPKGEKVVQLERLSGNIPLKAYRYDLKPFAGKEIEIKINFTSDAGVVSEGVTLDDLTLSPYRIF